MVHDLRLVDVFSDRLLGGNPLAVVVGSQGIAPEQMQRFASWMNLSETTFLLPPTAEAEAAGAHYRVRIFTPSTELPFAGHPTLGSCRVWLDTIGGPDRVPGAGSEIIQECGVGLVPIRLDGDRLSFRAPPLIRSGPVDQVEVERLARGLGLEPSEVVAASWVDNGPGWLALLLPDAETVLNIDVAAVDLDVGRIGAYLGVVGPYGRADPGPASRADQPAFELRAFFPSKGSIVEDPVTGSLNASVAQWLLGSGRASAPYVASQGTALGRCGRVHVTSGDDGIWVGGHVTGCVAGRVTL